MKVRVEKNNVVVGEYTYHHNNSDLHDWLMYVCDKNTDLGFYGHDIYQTIDGMTAQGCKVVFE